MWLQPFAKLDQIESRVVARIALAAIVVLIWLLIPRKSNQRKGSRDFDKQSYRRRSVIEQCVGRLKEYRRIGTRFEKPAVGFLAMLKPAMIRQYFKVSFSDTA